MTHPRPGIAAGILVALGMLAFSLPAASGQDTPAPTPEATIGVPGTDGWGPVGAPVPTKGRIPEDAIDANGEIDLDKVPDFISVWGRDGVSIAGYVAYRDLEPLEGSHPWWYQRPPTPVYAGDLRTLVGFMFDEKGFVPLGVDPDTVTELPDGAAPSMGPSVSPGPPALPSRLTTCGGHAYPGLGIDAPVEYGSIDEVQALGQALARFGGEFPGSRDWPWRLAGRDETGLLFLAETDALGPPGWVSVEVEPDGDGWRTAGMGQCDPRVVPSADLGPADWWPDPDHAPPDSDSVELHILVLERECASAASAEGRIGEPAVDYASDAVTITIGVRRRDGDQECPSNPPTPFIVQLTEPLADRILLDGGHARPVVPSPWDG